MSELTRDFVNPYARTVERGDLPPDTPTMEGPLYVRRKGLIAQATEIVPKEYVDQFTGLPVASIFQPYTVGNYYTGNLLGGFATTRFDPRPRGVLEWFALDRSYNFDALAINAANVGGSTIAWPAIYRMSEATYLPTELFISWGFFQVVAGTVTMNVTAFTLTRGLWGLYLQCEGGTGTTDLMATAASQMHGRQPIGIAENSLNNATSPPVYNGFVLTPSFLTAKVLPDPSKFAYDRLTTAGGCGLFLRRAA